MIKNSLLLFISVSLSLFYACDKQDLSDNEAPKIEILDSINKTNTLYIDSLETWKFRLSDNKSLSSFYIKIYHPNYSLDVDREDSVYYYRLFVDGGIFSTQKKDTTIIDSIRIDSKTTTNQLPIVTGFYKLEIGVMDKIGKENVQRFNVQIKNNPKGE